MNMKAKLGQSRSYLHDPKALDLLAVIPSDKGMTFEELKAVYNFEADTLLMLKKRGLVEFDDEFKRWKRV